MQRAVESRSSQTERNQPMPAVSFRTARSSAFALLMAVTSLTAAGTEGVHAAQGASASNIIAVPDQPGGFNVGIMVFSATLTGGRTTRVQVFYPTANPSPARRVTGSISSPGSITFNHPCAHARMPWPCRDPFHWLCTIMAAAGPEPISSEPRSSPCTKSWQAMGS